MFYTAIMRDKRKDKIISLRTSAGPDNPAAWVEIQKKLDPQTELVAIVRGDHIVYSENKTLMYGG